MKQKVDKPTPGDDEVLVRIHAVSVNAADYRSMKMGSIPKRKIFGSDIAGRIEAVGKNIRRFAVGDEVLGDISGCGLGGFAEFVAVPEAPLALKPAAVSYENAASVPMSAVTALQGLRNTLTIQETALVLQGLTIDKKPLKDHLEAVGHRDAFLYVRQLVSEKAKLSERIIRELHSLVLIDRPDDKGVYRRIPVRILGAHHEPPQPYLVPVQMEQLLAADAKSKRHPIERIALFHLQFEGVHPFIDGNGRTGRLLINHDLMQQGYPPIYVKFTDQKRYYACFDSYYRDQDPVSMIRLIGEAVDEQLVRYLSILDAKTNKRGNERSRVMCVKSEMQKCI